MDFVRSGMVGLIGAAVFAVFAVLLAAAKRGRGRDPATGELVVRFTHWFTGIFAFVGLFFLVAVVVIGILKPPRDRSEVIAMFGILGFSAAGFLAAAVSAKKQVRVTGEGLFASGLLGRDKTLPWDEITDVRLRENDCALRLGNGRTNISIHIWMVGCQECFDLAKERLPAGTRAGCEERLAKFERRLKKGFLDF